METLVTVHSFLRWAILVVGVTGAIVSLLLARRARVPGRGDLAAGTTFVALLDLQWLVGVVLYVVLHRGTWDAAMVGHFAIMTAAAGTAHVFRARARRGSPVLAARATLLACVVPLALVGVGHLVLPR